MDERDPFLRRWARMGVAGVGAAAVIFCDILPSDADQTLAQVYEVPGSPMMNRDELVITQANLFGGNALPMTHDNAEFALRRRIEAPKSNTADFLALLDEKQSDVVIASEVVQDDELFAGLRERGYNYIFDPARNLPLQGVDGNLIAVKEADLEYLGEVTLPTNWEDRTFLQEVRTLIYVRVRNSDGTHTSIFATHMTNTDKDWPGQAQAIRDYILSLNLPESEKIVLSGDMNKNTDEVRDSALQDIFHLPSDFVPVFTYPTNKYVTHDDGPDQEIDHTLMYSPDARCQLLNIQQKRDTDNFGGDHAATTSILHQTNCDPSETRPDIRAIAWGN